MAMNPPGDVPPPPPPGGGVPQPPSSGGGGNVDIGAAVSHGWNGFTQNIVPWLLAVLILGVGVGVAYFIGFFVLFGLASRGFLLMLIGYGLFIGLIFVVQLLAGFGLYNGALQASRGETPTLQTMWNMNNFGNYAVTSIIVAAITSVGFMLCYIPGIIAAFLLFLAPWLAIDQGLSPMDAVKASYERITKNIGGFFLLWIVVVLIYAAGAAICGVGIFVSAPVALMTFAYGYRQLGLDRG